VFFYLEAQKLNANDDVVRLSTLTGLEKRAEVQRRRLFVQEMIRDAWSGYVQYAWGEDALEPVSRTAYKKWFGAQGGLTLIQAMSTLWLVGMPEEFDRGRQWIVDNFNFTALDREVNVFVSVTELMGSMLGCYALTRDELFLRKAIDIANALEPAYSTPKVKFGPINLI